jgi:Cytochrome c3/Doubled CXXCH motif (Paired_CXXCH_1)
MRWMARASGVLSVALLLTTVLARAASGPPLPATQESKPAAPQETKPAAPAAPLPEKVAYCLECHEDKNLAITLKDGSSMSLYVNPAEAAKSVHAAQLICTDCHAKYEQDHPTGATFDSRRAYTVKSYELCKKCHFDAYTRTLESVHYDLLKSGFEGAPICVDCHGSHDIPNPHAKRAMMSRSCAGCHTNTYEAYAKSVHGRALVEDNNEDVPACADCHTHHQVQQPSTAKFRLSAPQVCAKCHGDAKLMSKYGISTTVAQTYLSDFHGVTASLAHNLSEAKQQVVVTCNDCHGVHDIASPKLKGQEAMKATVSAACNKCHADSAPSFPAAWLSHYPPSPRHAPLVWGIGLFYKIFIPFAVIGLCLHLLLHAYRMSAGR